MLASIVKKRAASDTLPHSPAKKSMTETSAKKDSNGDGASSSTNESNSVAADNHPPGMSRNGVMQETMGKCVCETFFHYCIVFTRVFSSVYPSAMKCVGVLPGIGSYVSDGDDTSDSERTSGSDIDENVYDLKGHPIEKKPKQAVHL